MYLSFYVDNDIFCRVMHDFREIVFIRPTSKPGSLETAESVQVEVSQKSNKPKRRRQRINIDPRRRSRVRTNKLDNKDVTRDNKKQSQKKKKKEDQKSTKKWRMR